MARKSFVANVTSASFVQREVARLAVTEGLFYLNPSQAFKFTLFFKYTLKIVAEFVIDYAIGLEFGNKRRA